MEDNYIFEILDDRAFIYTISDNEVKIGTVLRLDNQDDLINIELTEDISTRLKTLCSILYQNLLEHSPYYKQVSYLKKR